MNPLIELWPSTEHVEECLRTEAETVDQALLLAVHLPVMLKRRSAQSGKEVAATEADLLTALMRPVNDGSSVIVAITGASGVGKSHMIRWLGAQLDRHPRRNELVVVPIPKTASLREVVERILAPLSDARYSMLKEDLGRAVESLDPPRAAELLATALAEELGPYAAQVEEQIRANRDASQGPRITAARHMRNLIRDPDVRDRWFHSVLLRIVDTSLGGTSDPARRQFQPSDFEPPASIGDMELRNVVHQALAFLASSNGSNRTMAAEVLQEVLDAALRTIFRFTEALHQRTIQEVVDDIRRELLADGKELVLLIEDLAALSGIQQPLLDIMIAESDEKGVRVRAPIRTAVAVTDGFLAGRQTVLTRAREQWVVPSEGIDETTVTRLLVELTGRYLNAARYGVSYLKRQFANVTRDRDNLYSWVPKFDPTLDASWSEKLEAFGRSESGFSLFPFNVAAIRSLATSALKIGNAWTFNPRAYINEVLSSTLSQRFAFEAGNFPPANFRAPRLRSEVSIALTHHGFPPEQRGRIESTLFHWADNPTSLEVAPESARDVFDAFSLPWPFDAVARDRVKPPPEDLQKPPGGAGWGPGTQSPGPTGSENAGPTGASGPPPVAPPASAYAQALELWDQNTRLIKTYPVRTRSLLAEALNKRMDFGDYCLNGQEVNRDWFWLPPANTTSNPTKGLKIELSPPDSPIPPGVIAGLKALDRWDSNGKSWSYPNAETDYAAANALLERLEHQVLDLMLSEVVRDTGIAAITLHRQNLLLGVTTRADNPSLKDLLAAAPKETRIDVDTLPTPVRKAVTTRAQATESRVPLQERLRKYLACYQGKGDKVLAVDNERYRQALKREVQDRWMFVLTGYGEDGNAVQDVLDRLAPQAIEMLLRDLATAVNLYLPEAADAFAENHSRVAWRDELRAIIEQASQSFAWPTGSIALRDVRGAVDRLAAEPLDQAIQRLRKVQPVDDASEVHQKLAALSTVPLPQLIAIHTDVALLRRFFIELDKSVRTQINSIDGQAALQAHDKLLNDLMWEV
ncbi:protein DpdH [Burkholderia gladioli]|uniref:protein DpdH n=1 Tax=Burkholderia gladioli TaxID=28095 RepID=UPI000F5397EB|nr:protein DpdH [Burkholderia gladioli]